MDPKTVTSIKPMELGVDLLDPEVPFAAKANVCHRWGLLHAGMSEVPGTEANVMALWWIEHNRDEFYRWVDAGGHGDYEENLSALLNRDCDRVAAVQATKAKRGES